MLLNYTCVREGPCDARGLFSDVKGFGEEDEAHAGSLGSELCDFSGEEWAKGAKPAEGGMEEGLDSRC